MTAGRAKRLLLPALCILGVALFTALGVWQVERRSWKLDLIARVDERMHASPAAPPTAKAWPSLAAKSVEYRRVVATGVLLHDKETLVDALTERGPGWWVITPLRTDNSTILVNRGFVPPDRADQRSRQAGQISGPMRIEGLLRLSEPGGRFLRPNRPAENRWFSRDVAAIARARQLGEVAPYFIDAGAALNPGGLPTGGMTVIRFRNTHLIYALTWFGLAALSLTGLVLVRKDAQDKR
ncbi:MAG: SURF1 family protein [Sphingomonas bacterium]|nr:SURF1 family protein [Sphingomonas bacterium]